MRRTDLVVPGNLMAGLRIPARAAALLLTGIVGVIALPGFDGKLTCVVLAIAGVLVSFQLLPAGYVGFDRSDD